MNVLLVGPEPATVLRNAMNRLNIQMLQRLGGENVALLPGAISPTVEAVIIFTGQSSRKLADTVKQRARQLGIPVVLCRPSVNQLALAWSALAARALPRHAVPGGRGAERGLSGGESRPA